MRKYLLLFLSILFSVQIINVHKQTTHRYITQEAYLLLKKYIGRDIIPLTEHIQSGTCQPSSYLAWQDGTITTGAWQEDDLDVVYGYSNFDPPTLTGINGALIAFFASLGPEGFTSVTHFIPLVLLFLI